LKLHCLSGLRNEERERRREKERKRERKNNSHILKTRQFYSARYKEVPCALTFIRKMTFKHLIPFFVQFLLSSALFWLLC
jgi:hypothetical protein